MSLGQKCFGSKEIWSLKKFGFKKFDSKRNYHFENLLKDFLIKTNFGKILGPERFGSREVFH